jgi:hypothetical protein
MGAPESTTETNPHSRSRWQFGLGTMLGVVLACAVVLGLLVNTHEVYKLSARFARLPADDRGLADWFREQRGIEDLSINREGELIRVRYCRREVRPSFTITSPPFEQLGYTGLRRMSWEVSRPSPLGVVLTWLSAFPLGGWLLVATAVAALIVIQVLRRTGGPDGSAS